MYQMTETEYKFAELIWEEEPIGSGELVKQCAEKFGWTKYCTLPSVNKKYFKGLSIALPKLLPINLISLLAM